MSPVKKKSVEDDDLQIILRHQKKIRERLRDPDLSAGEWEELQIALSVSRKLEREVRELQKPVKSDGVRCGTTVAYEEIPLDKLDEVVTDDYVRKIIAEEFPRKRKK